MPAIRSLLAKPLKSFVSDSSFLTVQLNIVKDDLVLKVASCYIICTPLHYSFKPKSSSFGYQCHIFRIVYLIFCFC